MDQEINERYRDHFRCFARNLRWGTCVDCPCSRGQYYPEFCKNTGRYDHQLDVDQLANSFKMHKEYHRKIKEVFENQK